MCYLSLTGAGAQREAQKRLKDPSSIPYEELLTLPSRIDPLELSDMPISLLFLASSDTSVIELSTSLAQLSTQSHSFISNHVQFSSPAHSDIVDSLPANISPYLPTSETSSFTLIVPITSNIRLGPSINDALLQLSGTKEFSGALLELGCRQAAFVQTTWLDQLQFGTFHQTPSWRVNSISSIRVPLVSSVSASDDFWVDGLQDCSARTSIQESNAPIDGGQVKFIIEPDEDGQVRWYGGWKELVCEFASRTDQWTPSILLISTSTTSEDEFHCDDGLELLPTVIDISTVTDQVLMLHQNQELDVLLYMKDGQAEHELRKEGISTLR